MSSLGTHLRRPGLVDNNEKVIAYAAAGLAVASTSAALFLSATIDPCATLDEWTVAVALAISLTFMLVVSIHLVRDR